LDESNRLTALNLQREVVTDASPMTSCL
jgi:hypothetical protein